LTLETTDHGVAQKTLLSGTIDMEVDPASVDQFCS